MPLRRRAFGKQAGQTKKNAGQVKPLPALIFNKMVTLKSKADRLCFFYLANSSIAPDRMTAISGDTTIVNSHFFTTAFLGI